MGFKRKMEECQQAAQKKRREFDTSTPIQYRQPAWDTDVSSSDDITQLSTDGRGKSSAEDGMAGQGKTNLSRETEKVVIDTDKPPETPTQILAGYAVTLDSFHAAEDSFIKRQNMDVLSTDGIDKYWKSDEKFKANQDDSKSFEVCEILQDQEDWYLDILFQQVEENTQRDLNETYGINYDTTWLFGNIQEIYFEEDNIEQRQVEDMIRNKKENKLYDIFLKQQRLAPTPKRKLSPQEEAQSKLRRMTISNSSASPAFRTPRRRLQTGAQGSRSLSRSARLRQTGQDGRKQALIVEFYKKDCEDVPSEP